MANANARKLLRKKANLLCSVINDDLMDLEPYELRDLRDACKEAEGAKEWSMKLAAKLLMPELENMLAAR